MAFRNLSSSSIFTGYKSSKLWDQTTFPGTFESINTVYLSSAQATISFTNIPQTYAHLQIRATCKHATASTAFEVAIIQFNSTAMTKGHYLYGNGASALSGVPANGAVMNIPGANSTNIFATGIIDILDYTNVNKNKTFRSLSGVDLNGSGELVLYSGFYGVSATPVSSISFTIAGGHSFATNSHFALYGIRSA